MKNATPLFHGNSPLKIEVLSNLPFEKLVGGSTLQQKEGEGTHYVEDHTVKYFIIIFIILLNVVREINTSVMRQKDEAQNECFKKAKHAKFSEKRTFRTLWQTNVRARIRE